jgi:hypothetical protein
MRCISAAMPPSPPGICAGGRAGGREAAGGEAPEQGAQGGGSYATDGGTAVLPAPHETPKVPPSRCPRHRKPAAAAAAESGRAHRLVDHAQEVLLVRVDGVEQLRVVLAQLLQHGLQQRGVLLHQAAERLELRVVAQVGQRAAAAAAAAAGPAAAAAGSKHVEGEVGGGGGLLAACRRGGAGRGGRGGGGRLHARGDAGHQVLDGAVGVVVGGSQGADHLLPGEAHLHDLGDLGLQGGARGQLGGGRGVGIAGSGGRGLRGGGGFRGGRRGGGRRGGGRGLRGRGLGLGRRGLGLGRGSGALLRQAGGSGGQWAVYIGRARLQGHSYLCPRLDGHHHAEAGLRDLALGQGVVILEDLALVNDVGGVPGELPVLRGLYLGLYIQHLRA